MKKNLYVKFLFVFLIFMWSSSSQSAEFSYYKCKSQKHNDISEFEVLFPYKNNFLVFSHTIMNVGFLNLGYERDGIIRSYMSDPINGAMIFYQISKENNNNRTISLYNLESEKIKNLNSKSMFYGKTLDQINIELTEGQINQEIQKFIKNQNYLIDLFDNRKDQIGSELVMSEEYSCEKTTKANIDKSKPSKAQIELMKLGCIGNEPYEKKKAYCKCYGDWFYKNLNQAEYDKFLFLNKEDKMKFLKKNKIIEQCKSYSEVAPNAEKFLKELSTN